MKPEVKVVEKKPEVVGEKIEVNNDESSGEWITVKDKKAVKKTTAEDKPVKVAKEVKVKSVETEVAVVQAAPVAANTEDNSKSLI